MNFKCFSSFFSIMLIGTLSLAQPPERFEKIMRNGELSTVLIVGNDTIPVMDIDTVSFTAKKNFANRDEHRKFNLIRSHALSVYPLAAEAIKLYRQTQEATKDMKKKDEKKYIKQEEERLTLQYEKKLKSLSKVQGYILLKMIERELKTPFYDVLSQLRGGWQAFKWQAVARWWGFNLKDGYDHEKDPQLEMILSDLNISYK